MSRPGLIIGLGGTGQWVLTWLKRDLLLSNNGQMPSNVRLLEIDTQTRLEAGTTRVKSGGEEEATVVGGVSLDKGEFIYVGGDSRPIAEAIQKGQFKQIGQWYHTDRWLQSQAPSNFILDDGAGRLRQFGRMAVFKDVLGRQAGSQIWKGLRAAMDSVRTITDEQRKLEIIVVGSFAGGTGSGMFIDIALILRLLAKQLNIHHVLRGFFALPGVFTAAPDAQMRARSMAAWRELNRFMVVDSDFTMPAVEYVADDPEFRISPDTRLFDACYLVDGKRGGTPIADDAKYGVFPMITEAVSAILDEKAGTAYTQWIFTNLAPEYARHADIPMYSAVGAYTVQVPVHYKQEVSSHKFAQKMLLNLLSPVRQPDKEDRLAVSGAERHLSLAAPDKNLEDRGFAGRSKSRELLLQAINFGAKSAKPTPFHSRVASLVEQAVEDSRRAGIVDRLARSGADPRAAAESWISFFPNLGDAPEFEAVRKAVVEYMTYSILKSYGRREGQKEDEVRAKFKNIPEDMRKRFGGVTSSGEEVEDFYGECGDRLRDVQRTQLIIFRQLMRLRLTALLMGQSEDAIVARSGKLGYAWDYLDGLVVELDKFLKLMVDVKRERDRIKPELKLFGLSEQAKRYLSNTSGKKIFWLWEHPNVKSAELGYLQAQERMMDLRREDILHFFVSDTVRFMKEIATESRDAIQRWIWHLSTGDEPSGLPGMWEGVRDSLNQVNAAHSFDTRVDKVQHVVAEEVKEVNEADLRQALSRWEWSVELEGDMIKPIIQARLLPYEDIGGQVRVLDNPSLQSNLAQREDASRKNRSALMGLAKKKFGGKIAETTVADVIKQEYPDPAAFINQVANISAEPLFDGAPGASCPKKSNFIRVMVNSNDSYFMGAEGVEGELRYVHNLDRAKPDDVYGIQVVGSENPYKLTMVRTDDLYPYNNFAAWQSCLTAYAAHMSEEGQPMDPVLMQNFAAEARAVEFERRLSRGGADYKPLHPRVVTLLEEPIALRQFVYLFLLGLINEDSGEGDTAHPGIFRWQLEWEKATGPQTIWLSRPWNKDRDKATRNQPDIFNAIHGFVIRKSTQEPGRRDKVDNTFAQILIDKKMKEVGPDKEMKALLANQDENGNGLIADLMKKATDPDTGFVVRDDYNDLAQVVRLMIEDRITELKKIKAAKGSEKSGQISTGSVKRVGFDEPDSTKRKSSSTTKKP